MNVQQWLKLVIDVLEFAIERIPVVPTDSETSFIKEGPAPSGGAVLTGVPRTSESTEFTDGKVGPEAPPVVAIIPHDLGPKVIFDAEGIPWDERIHGSGRTFLAKDGCWKLKRGIDPVLVAKVKTELKIAQGATAAIVPPAPIDTITTWAQLMDKIAAAETHPETVLAACNKFNVANIGTLQDTPVLVPLVATELGF